jgi:hypothetical protein
MLSESQHVVMYHQLFHTSIYNQHNYLKYFYIKESSRQNYHQTTSHLVASTKNTQKKSAWGRCQLKRRPARDKAGKGGG